MGKLGLSLAGFFLEEQELSQKEESEAIPSDMFLPEIAHNVKLPRNSDVPYLVDFDDSGMDRFLEEEFDNCRVQANWVD